LPAAEVRHLLFAVGLFWGLATRPLDDASVQLFLGVDAAMLLFGYLVSAALGLVGLIRRRMFDCAWALLLIPLYWLLLPIAAWRALFQLMRSPYRWEKTEHGLARTSRLSNRRAHENGQR
jgi:hypothetical protein